MTIKIERNVPIPKNNSGGTPYKYPWVELKVGDSFLAPNITVNVIGGSKRPAEKKTGFKFVCRTVNGGVRVWRIK